MPYRKPTLYSAVTVSFTHFSFAALLRRVYKERQEGKVLIRKDFLYLDRGFRCQADETDTTREAWDEPGGGHRFMSNRRWQQHSAKATILSTRRVVIKKVSSAWSSSKYHSFSGAGTVHHRATFRVTLQRTGSICVAAAIDGAVSVGKVKVK